MLNKLSDYLPALAEYAKAADDSKPTLESLANVYGDLLNFFSKARGVFVVLGEAKRRRLSIRVFLRVQWEPLEAVFGDIERKFSHHLNVLSHIDGASQLNTIHRLEKMQNSELDLSLIGFQTRFN